MHYWIWKIGTTWTRQEKAADPIVGCSAPLYTPTKHQSDRAINGCSPIPLEYKWNGAAWECLNCVVTSSTDLTFTGSGPTYNLNSSTGSGVTLKQGANTTFTRTGNELEIAAEASTDAQTLSFSNPNLSISGGNSVDLSALTPSTEVVQDIAGGMVSGNTETLISVTYDDTNGKLDFAVEPDLSNYNNDAGFLTAEVDGSVTNELQTIANSSDATSHTQTLSNSGGSTQYIEGTGIGLATGGTSLNGTVTITNTLPDQTVVLNNGAGISATGTYPNFTITNTSPSLWTDGGTDTYLTATTDNVAIGTSTANSKVDVTTNGLGVTQTTTSGIVLSNNTAAAAGAQQISPALRLRANGWKTNATAASQTVDFRSYALPIQGAANPTGSLIFQASVNGGAYVDGLKVGTDGSVTVGTLANTGLKFEVRGSDAGGLFDRTGDEPFIILAQSGTYLSQIRGTSGGGLKFTNSSAATIWGRFDASGNFGVGVAPARKLHVESSDAVTNAVTYQQRLSHITSGTAAAGFGAGQEVELENASGTNRVSQTQETTFSDATNATEDATYTLKLIRAGTLTAAQTTLSTGETTFAGDVTVPDEAYGSGWDASLEVPTKNAVYDKIEAVAGSSLGTGFTSGGGSGTIPNSTTAALGTSGDDYKFATTIGDITGFTGVQRDADNYVGTGINTAINSDFTFVSNLTSGDFSCVYYVDPLGLNVNSYDFAVDQSFAMTFSSSGIVFGSGGSGSPNTGVLYADDYSATFVDRSLVDKAYADSRAISGSFSGVGTATTVFTVTIGVTMPNTTYKVNVTPTAALSAALFHVANKTTTTFDVTYLAGLTGTVTFDWSVFP